MTVLAKTSGYKVLPEDVTLITDKTHPFYDPRVEDAVDPLLMDSIRANGVLHPILLKRNGKDSDGIEILQVIDGRNRVKACLALNKGKKEDDKVRLPAVIVNGSDSELVLKMLEVNIHRKDETIFSKAFKMRKAIQLGASENDVRRACRCSATELKNLLAFLDLDKEAQAAFETRAIPKATIPVIADIPKEEQAKIIRELKAENVTKEHEVRNAVEAKRKGETYTPPDTKKMMARPRLETWVKELKKAHGPCEAVAVLEYALGNSNALKKYPDLLPKAASSLRTPGKVSKFKHYF